MTIRTTYLILLLTLPFALAAQSVEKTFSKSFNTESKGTIRLNLPGTIDLKVWDNPTIRIGITISIPSGSSAMLGELANVGRYNMMPKTEGDVLTISMPNMQKQIRIKGEELRETLTFVVYVPKDVKVEMPKGEMVADKR